MKNEIDNPYVFLSGGGQLGALTREMDWSNSLLGTPDQWPCSLRISVSNLLRTNLPMLVLWGPEHICFYNDAVLPSLGPEMHPSVGRPAGQIWTDGRGFIRPQLNQVFISGKAVSFRDAPVTFYRNGRVEQVYCTFSYSPILDDQGETGGILVTCLDTTQHVKSFNALKEKESVLNELIDLAELGSYSIDILTNKMVKSPRVAHWYGLPEFTNVSASLSAVDEADRERISKVLADALVPGSRGSFKVEYSVISAATGQKRILRTNGQVFRDQYGQAVRVEGAVMDITSQHDLRMALEKEVLVKTQELRTVNQMLSEQNINYLAVNKQLKEANKLLAHSNESLQQFTYVASHDLQEPLRKIQQYADLIKRHHPEHIGKSMPHLERIQLTSKRMSALIDDLLDYSKISNEPRISTPVSLNEVVADVLADSEVLIREIGAKILVSSLPEVKGVPSQLRQLFQNLISNALKFRRPGVPTIIEVTAQIVQASQLPDLVKPSLMTTFYHRIEVVDNGIGFEQKNLAQIFQAFQRLHGRSEFPGTGIGLAICERVVSNHGGAIAATSALEKGSAFIIFLPKMRNGPIDIVKTTF